jgi:hypothetical protein
MPEATAAASTTAATAVNSSNDENNAAAIIPPAVDLSPFQVEKVAELRRELGDQLLTKTPLFNDDYSLVRWLNGWNYKIGAVFHYIYL